jgi:hypothetical protein
MVRHESLRGTTLQVKQRLCDVDNNGFVMGLDASGERFLLTIPGYEKVSKAEYDAITAGKTPPKKGTDEDEGKTGETSPASDEG